jgi:hypothetical protein
MLTLDGRMRFNLPLAPADEQRFRSERVIEIALNTDSAGLGLDFIFEGPTEAAARNGRRHDSTLDLPSYIVIADVAAPGALVEKVPAAIATTPTIAHSTSAATATRP